MSWRPVSTQSEDQTYFELRLEGGVTLAFGPRRPGDGGVARLLRAPEFCRDPELMHCLDEQMKAQWELSPLDAKTRRAFADANRTAHLVDISGISRGVGFIAVRPGDKRVSVELWLPMTDFRRTGISTFEDWLCILREVKDDLNREALLRLRFPSDRMRKSDIAAFKEGKRLGTTGVELHVRPRAIQWSRDD
jgi:hypothetical protein